MDSKPPALQSDLLSPLPGIAHGFFTRAGGVSGGVFSSLNCAHGTGDAPENVDENLRRIQNTLETEGLVKAWQVHGISVAIAETPWSFATRPQADAIVTRTPRLAIGVTTADCAPVLLADAEARVIACAHAGWKGALAGVLRETVTAMESLGANRARIHAAIGPCIAPNSYEVGPEFAPRFLEQDAGNAQFFTPSPREGHCFFDLRGYVHAQLQKERIAAINPLANDTCMEENAFFSYRRACLRGEKTYGCQLSAIALR